MGEEPLYPQEARPGAVTVHAAAHAQAQPSGTLRQLQLKRILYTNEQHIYSKCKDKTRQYNYEIYVNNYPQWSHNLFNQITKIIISLFSIVLLLLWTTGSPGFWVDGLCPQLCGCKKFGQQCNKILTTNLNNSCSFTQSIKHLLKCLLQITVFCELQCEF